MAVVLFAQQNKPAGPDDEFNVFLMVFALIAVSVMMGSVMIGAFFACLALLIISGLIAMGILSVSVVAGLYKRSLQAGFKTFCILVCSGAGVITGIGGVLLARYLFEFDISDVSAVLAGATGGLCGGILLGLLIFRTAVLALAYLKRKFAPAA